MKKVRVAAAVIVRDNCIFAAERGYGDMKGGWEFPGGKIEPGETPEEALKREIMEELDTAIEIDDYLDTIEYDYPSFHLSMVCYRCHLVSGEPILKEAVDAAWLRKDELDSVSWLPADRLLLPLLQKQLQE